MSEGTVVISGTKYSAWNVGGTTWMVKRFKYLDSPEDDQAQYVEALISVDTADPQVAIDAAIKRGSWA